MAQLLVVDDSATTVLFLETVLAECGHEVLAVRRAGEIAALEGRRPDLVLLDLHLPGWSHEEVLRELRDRWPGDLPVVIHSSYPMEKLREAIERVGAVGAIGKGSSPVELQQAVEGYLSRDSQPGSST